MASHSSTLACKIPWMAEPGRLQSMGFKESDMTERLHFTFTQPSETQASFLMHSFFIHSSRFLLKNVWSLSAALLWLSSLEATEVLTPIFHGGGVCLSCHGSPYRGRYWTSKECKGFSDSWGHHNSLPPFPPFRSPPLSADSS